MSIIQMLFSANGRIRRRDYWLCSIGVTVVSLAIQFVAHQLITGNPASAFFADSSAWTSFNVTPLNIFLWVFTALLLWPSICLAAKRWHDRNRTGWIAGFVVAATYAAIFLQLSAGPDVAGGTEGINWPVYGGATLVMLALGIWQFIEVGCLDGTPGANRYGPSPKGLGASPDVF